MTVIRQELCWSPFFLTIRFNESIQDLDYIIKSDDFYATHRESTWAVRVQFILWIVGAIPSNYPGDYVPPHYTGANSGSLLTHLMKLSQRRSLENA